MIGWAERSGGMGNPIFVAVTLGSASRGAVYFFLTRFVRGTVVTPIKNSSRRRP